MRSISDVGAQCYSGRGCEVGDTEDDHDRGVLEQCDGLTEQRRSHGSEAVRQFDERKHLPGFAPE